jgi:hypothetical protein
VRYAPGSAPSFDTGPTRFAYYGGREWTVTDTATGETRPIEDKYVPGQIRDLVYAAGGGLVGESGIQHLQGGGAVLTSAQAARLSALVGTPTRQRVSIGGSPSNVWDTPIGSQLRVAGRPYDPQSNILRAFPGGVGGNILRDLPGLFHAIAPQAIAPQAVFQHGGRVHGTDTCDADPW